jgi:hypothetical protein
MDSFGDYIYIIAIIVAGLSSFLKKKKTDTSSDSKPRTSKRNWEDVIKDLIPIEEDVEPDVQYKPIIEKKVADNQIKKTIFNEGTSSLRGTKQVSQLISQKKQSIEDDKDTEVESIFNDYSFESIGDAKRAFIYSEIFNRKY